MAEGFDALRDLIAILGNPEKFFELPEPVQDLNLKQAAEALRVSATALREIAWLNDQAKVAPQNIKNAKYKAMIAMKKARDIAIDYDKAMAKAAQEEKEGAQ